MKLLITILLFILVGVFGFSQKKQSKNSVTKNYSEEQALGYIDDYYNFYNADEFYDNLEARKISNNIFYIKVETCLGGKIFVLKKSITSQLK